MNVIHSNLDFPRKMESCADCGGQVWNLRRELSFFGVETCVDCGEIAGICQHWLHLYTYLEPHTLMPLSHGIQRASLRFHLEQNASLEIHSDQLPQTSWLETPLSPSAALRNKFGYRCQFAPVWSSTRASQPSMYSRLEGKVTPSQMVTQIHQLQTTPSVSNIQLESCQQQRYPHQLQQSKQKHKQQKPQSLQRKLQQVPAVKPTTASPETPQVANKPDVSKPQAKSAPSKIASKVPVSTPPPAAIEVISTGKEAATAVPTATAVQEAVAPAAAIETGSTGKAATTVATTATAVQEAVAPAAAIETGSTGKAATTVATTATAVQEAVAPAAAIETGSTGKPSQTAVPTATAVQEAVAPAAAIETGSTGKAATTVATTATAVQEAVAPAAAIETGSTGKPSQTAVPIATAVQEAVAPAAPIVTVSTDIKAAEIAAATATALLEAVAPAAVIETTSTGQAAATAAPAATAVPEAVAPAAAIATVSTDIKAAEIAAATATALLEAVAPATVVETTSTGQAAATAVPTATAVQEAVAQAASIVTGSTDKAAEIAAPAASDVPEAVASAAPIVTGSTDIAAEIAAPTTAAFQEEVATAAATATAVLRVVASPSQQQSTTKDKSSIAQRSALTLAPKRSAFATTSLFSRPPSDVTKTAAPESKSAIPVQHPRVETPKPQSSAAALPAGAQAASTTSSQGSSPGQQQSEHTSPKQPKQRFSPVTQVLDDYLQGINIPSIEQSDLQHPPQGQVVLGQGAHGGVLLMLYNNEHVAVKCVPTGDKDTVDREVRILSVLSEHDSFPNVHGTIEAGQFRAVAMQFIGDEASARCLTLGEALTGSRSLTLDPADWRSIAMNVVDGIKHMHSEGLLHNDIKMDNILMSYDTPTHRWRAYVIDVGVATTTNAPRNYVLTSEEKKKYRRFHGHIAPEMVDNAEHQSIQSDIFQLGYVLHSIGQFGAVPFLEQLGDKCKSRDPSERPEMTHVRYCIKNNIFIQ
ncbi:uncharacterized protein [Asterias amurensis]